MVVSFNLFLAMEAFLYLNEKHLLAICFANDIPFIIHYFFLSSAST